MDRRTRVLALAMALALSVTASPALATSCKKPALAGHWINTEAATNEIVRLEIIFHCLPVRRGPQGMTPPTKWTIRGFAKCSPANCLWGRAGLHRDGRGRLTAVFNTFSARRYITLREIGNEIRVDYLIDYRGNRRPDQKGVVVMRREK